MFVVRSLVILSTLLIVSFASASENADVRLVVTGNLMGAIRECHCPSGQPGGLARRKTIFDNIRSETPDAIFIETGRLTNDKMDGHEIELQKLLLYRLDYDIVNCYLIDFYRVTPGLIFKGDLKPDQLKSLVPYSGEIDNFWPKLNTFPFELNLDQILGSTRRNKSPDLTLLNRIRVFEFDSVSGNKVVIASRTANYEYALLDSLIKKRYSIEKPYDISNSGGINEITPSDFPSDALSILVRNMVIGDNPEQDENEIPVELHGSENLKNLDIVVLGNDGYIEPDIEKSSLQNYYPENSVIPEKDILIVRPGLYGEYVLVIDIDVNDRYDISSFEWEAIPTRSVEPDSSMQSYINQYYLSPWIEELDR